MKKFVLTCFSAIVFLSVMAQYPDLSQYTISGIATTTFKYDCFLNSSCESKRQKRVTEVPPWIVGGGWRSYFFVDGRESHIWSSPKSLIDNSVIDLKNDAVGPFRAMYPHINDYQYSTYPLSNNWKRNYSGIYAAQYFSHATEGTLTLGFIHGENKNEVIGGGCGSGGTQYKNTIQSNVNIDCNNTETYTVPGREGWDAYNGIISASWVHNNASTNWGQQYFSNSLGPICWPNNGYITASGVKCTAGFRHPSSIQYGDYLYIFVVQGSSYKGNIVETEGRKGGVKVLRVHKDEALNSANYKIYYKDPGGIESWNPSLPAGLTKDNMLSYVATPGPMSSDILNDDMATADIVRFSVAKVKGKNYFMGLEQYHVWGDPNYKLAIRFSYDLLNWSDRYIVYQSSSWETSQLNYPIFLDKYGWSNTDVDEDDFYVIGTEHGPIDHVNKLHLYKYTPPPVDDPPIECPPNVDCPEEKVEGAVMPVDASKANIENRMRSTIVTENKHAVYPNPTNGIFYVTFPQQSKLKSVRILDQDSRVLYSKTISESFGNLNGSQKLDISSFQKGVYFVELVFHNERRISKIVKL